MQSTFLMENPDESVRLDVKTDVEAVRNQAAWCGVKPGLRILDVGCGSGKTSSILHEMIQPQGARAHPCTPVGQKHKQPEIGKYGEKNSKNIIRSKRMPSD